MAQIAVEYSKCNNASTAQSATTFNGNSATNLLQTDHTHNLSIYSLSSFGTNYPKVYAYKTSNAPSVYGGDNTLNGFVRSVADYAMFLANTAIITKSITYLHHGSGNASLSISVWQYANGTLGYLSEMGETSCQNFVSIRVNGTPISVTKGDVSVYGTSYKISDCTYYKGNDSTGHKGTLKLYFCAIGTTTTWYVRFDVYDEDGNYETSYGTASGQIYRVNLTTPISSIEIKTHT